MEEFESIRLLKEFLAQTPNEELIKQWDDLSKLDLGGPTVEEFLYFEYLIPQIIEANNIECKKPKYIKDTGEVNYALAA